MYEVQIEAFARAKTKNESQLGYRLKPRVNRPDPSGPRGQADIDRVPSGAAPTQLMFVLSRSVCQAMPPPFECRTPVISRGKNFPRELKRPCRCLRGGHRSDRSPHCLLHLGCDVTGSQRRHSKDNIIMVVIG